MIKFGILLFFILFINRGELISQVFLSEPVRVPFVKSDFQSDCVHWANPSTRSSIVSNNEFNFCFSFKSYEKTSVKDVYILLNGQKDEVVCTEDFFSYKAKLKKGINTFRIVFSSFGKVDTSSVVTVCYQRGKISQSRLALVFENTVLGHGDTDSEIANFFADYGFDVLHYKNSNYSEMSSAFAYFSEISQFYDVVFFYFNGDCFQFANKNYLLPVDYKIVSEKDIPLECFSFESVIRIIGEHKRYVNVVIIDGISELNDSRLFYDKLDIKSGLTSLFAPSDFLILYGSSLGRVVPSAVLRQRYLVHALEKVASVRKFGLSTAINRVQSMVIDKSSGRQNIWYSDYLTNKFCFFE